MMKPSKKQIYERLQGLELSALYLMSKSFFNGHPIEDLKRMLKVSLFDNYSKPLQEALIKFSYFDTISPKQAAYILMIITWRCFWNSFTRITRYYPRQQKQL